MNNASLSLISGLVTATFQALSGAGSVSIPGLLAGDIVLTGTINGLSFWPSFSTMFETVISVDGQLQQTGGDFVGPAFVVYLLRPAK